MLGAKPLLPVAGKVGAACPEWSLARHLTLQPMIWHPLAALAKMPGLSEILIIGFYEDSVMNGFIKDAKREFPNIGIRFVSPGTSLPILIKSYLREYRPLGTAGGLYHCEQPSGMF